MNQRLEGWKLVLAVLVPAAIVAVAIWFALQALTGDDSTSVDSSQQRDLIPTSTPTAPPQTDEVDEPTVVPTPTPLDLPAAPPAPTPTTAPAMTPTPTPTVTPTASGSPPPSGPTPTPTVDPSIVTLTCVGVTFPVTLEEGDSLAALSAGVAPPERAASLQFVWNFGNGRTAGAPNTSPVVYTTEGTYTVTLQATDPATGEVFTVTCGIVTVEGSTIGTITVTCTVRPSSSGISWPEATINDLMVVRTTWTPAEAILTLQYEFGLNDPIIFSNDATSGDSLTRIFSSLSDTVKIFWRNEDTGASGRISCPAFTEAPPPTPTPGSTTPTPTPTGTAATPTPTVGTTPTATATATPTPTSITP